jgi:hypothetical protein
MKEPGLGAFAAALASLKYDEQSLALRHNIIQDVW